MNGKHLFTIVTARDFSRTTCTVGNISFRWTYIALHSVEKVCLCWIVPFTVQWLIFYAVGGSNRESFVVIKYLMTQYHCKLYGLQG